MGETGPSPLPEDNTLPFAVQESEKVAEHGESTVYGATVEDNNGDNREIALKQVRRKEFASHEEVVKDKQFYDGLKASSLGKFIPKTHFVVAQMTPEDYPQEFRVQQFIKGRTIDKIDSSELYSDPVVVKQLMELADAGIASLKEAKEKNTPQPDFKRAPKLDSSVRALIGGFLWNPRYTKNIVIADEADENGQRVFFVDSGENLDARIRPSKRKQEHGITNDILQWYLATWKKKLEGVLGRLTPKDEDSPVVK